MTTNIKYGNTIQPLSPSSLGNAMEFSLTKKLEMLKAKLKRAKSPMSKMVWRSQVAEINYKLTHLNNE